MKCIVYNYKNASNLGKLFFPKIHRRISNVPRWPVISNCGTTTKRTSNFLYCQMQSSWPYINDSGDFTQKIKRISNILNDAILVPADIVELYPSIPHELGLKALEEALVKKPQSTHISTSYFIKMAKFVLQNNSSELNGRTKQQISGTAIGTTFAPPYACIFMDQVELEFLKTQIYKSLVWFKYIDIFFIWTHG